MARHYPRATTAERLKGLYPRNQQALSKACDMACSKKVIEGGEIRYVFMDRSSISISLALKQVDS